MTVLIDEEYGKAMIKQQEQVLPELRAKPARMVKLMKTSTSGLAICAMDLAIRLHEQRRKENWR